MFQCLRYFVVTSVAIGLIGGCKKSIQTEEEYLTLADSEGVSSNQRDLFSLCGQTSLESLMKEAHTVVECFSSSNEIASLVPDVKSAVLRNNAARSAHRALYQEYPWLKKSQEEFESLRSFFLKGKGDASSLMQIEWIKNDSNQGCDVLCFYDRNALIKGNLNWVDNVIFKRLGSSKGSHYLKLVMTHELGHFMVDHYFIKVKKLTDTDYAKMLDRDFIANHLIVDAVSMAINKSPTTEFANMLGELGVPQENNDTLVINDDQKARIRCLKELPSMN